MMQVRSFLLAATVALAAASATPASAAVIYSLTGNTTSGPTFNRPLAGNPPTSTSGVGTAVAYNTLLFSVNTTGSYDFLLNSATAGYDPFLILYQGIFNAGTPLAGALVANDDITPGNFTQSGFTRSLISGQIYTAVITGFDNLDFGAYAFTIADTVATTPVPEPAAWAMMIGGMGLVGAAMRRRANTRMKVTFA